MEFDDADYEQKENVEPEPPRRRKRARRRANQVIDAEAGVDGYASGHEQSDNENDDLYGFLVPDDIEFQFSYYLFQFISYFII